MNLLKDYLKAHTSKALREGIRGVQSEWKLADRHRRSVKKARGLLRGSPLKLNLGCGKNPRSEWVNVDLMAPRADLQLDLRENWPFPNGSVSYVYSEHVFEHFELREEVPHFLSEAFRVLNSGGLFDVGVPDTEWTLQAYGHSDHEYWRFAKRILPDWCETQLDFINFHFRQCKEWGEHKYAWDAETLRRSLEGAGFRSVMRRQFDPTLDSESRRTGTLYMRATKP